MRISKKTKLRILNAVSAATVEMLLDIYPDYEQWGAPDTWDRDEIKVVDRINLFESKIVRNIERVLEER